MKKLSGILLIISSALLMLSEIYYIIDNFDYALEEPMYLFSRMALYS